jgi:hypothetical protein
MASKITQQQCDDLNASHGRPVPVEDDEGHKLYFLVEADYLHSSHEQLKALIQEGTSAPHGPADEAEAELRRYADQLARKPARSFCYTPNLP